MAEAAEAQKTETETATATAAAVGEEEPPLPLPPPARRPRREQQLNVTAFPEEVLEHVLAFLETHRDRNSVSQVCKAFYRVEAGSRSSVFISNCYAVAPKVVISRFPRVRAVQMKGKPRFADFNMLPPLWGADLCPWATAFARAYAPSLERLRLKRMVISDDTLVFVARSFPNFKSLVLVNCEGFSTHGLGFIAACCRNLTELELHECDIDDRGGHWLDRFPESCTSLVSLNFACLTSEVNFEVLERLVARSPNLRSLKLNRLVPMEWLHRLLVNSPQLVDLGAGSYRQKPCNEDICMLRAAFQNCKALTSLSGFWEIAAGYLPALYPICMNLTSLNLSYATVHNPELIVEFISQCHRLQRLWVLDYIGDKGIEIVASSCRELQEIRVFPLDPEGSGAVTEEGLIAIAKYCQRLTSILYFCLKMTNDALITIAKSCPLLTRFRLCIIIPKVPDCVTLKPFDEGYGAVVQHCEKLQRMSLSGWVTDRAFQLIGKYGKNLEMLALAFNGDTDSGMEYLLSGCPKLRKLEIRDCPFGDKALLAGSLKYESMRSLWMSTCPITVNGCKELAAKMPRLNVEIQDGEDEMEVTEDEEQQPQEITSVHQYVHQLYLYRSLAGRRDDAPHAIRVL